MSKLQAVDLARVAKQVARARDILFAKFDDTTSASFWRQSPTQRDLAEAIGVSQPAAGKLIKGQTAISLARFLELCQATGRDPVEVVAEMVAPSTPAATPKRKAAKKKTTRRAKR